MLKQTKSLKEAEAKMSRENSERGSRKAGKMAAIGLPGLRAARKAKGLTQERLGEILGVPREKISCLETGRNDSSFAFLVRLCGALGTEAGFLLTGEGTRSGNPAGAEAPKNTEAAPEKARASEAESRAEIMLDISIAVPLKPGMRPRIVSLKDSALLGKLGRKDSAEN